MAADEELAPFLPDDAGKAADGDAATQHLERDLLVFSHGANRFAVHSRSVLTVVPYRAPSRVPISSPHLAGLVQDQGRLIALALHPTLRSDAGTATPARIVICETPRGFIGLPATQTHDVAAVRVQRTPEHCDVIAHPDGALTFVDVEHVSQVLVAE